MNLNKAVEEMGLSKDDRQYIFDNEKFINDITENLWNTVSDTSSYLFNASHSVCVSLDSLYTAYIKAHYPLEFYEVILEMASDDKDTEKVALLKNEAYQYKNIKVEDLKFGQDNTKFTSNVEKNVIYQSLLSVKDINETTASTLRDLGHKVYDNFYDLYRDMKEHKISKTHISNLCKIGYFTDIEPSKRKALWLSENYDTYNKKVLKKDKIESLWSELKPKNMNIMEFYNYLKSISKKETEKQITFDDNILCKSIYELLEIKDDDKVEEYAWEAHLTGTTLEEIEDNVLIGKVIKYNPSSNRILFKHIKNGKETYIKINCHNHIKEKDIVFVKSITTKNYKGRTYITAESIDNLTEKYLSKNKKNIDK